MGKGSFSFCHFASHHRPKKTVTLPLLPSPSQPLYAAEIFVSPNDNNCLLVAASALTKAKKNIGDTQLWIRFDGLGLSKSSSNKTHTLAPIYTAHLCYHSHLTRCPPPQHPLHWTRIPCPDPITATQSLLSKNDMCVVFLSFWRIRYGFVCGEVQSRSGFVKCIANLGLCVCNEVSHGKPSLESQVIIDQKRPEIELNDLDLLSSVVGEEDVDVGWKSFYLSNPTKHNIEGLAILFSLKTTLVIIFHTSVSNNIVVWNVWIFQWGI